MVIIWVHLKKLVHKSQLDLNKLVCEWLVLNISKDKVYFPADKLVIYIGTLYCNSVEVLTGQYCST